MSASICYRPIEKNHKTIGCIAPSSFLAALQETFGELPLRLDKSDVPILRGMSNAVHSDTSQSYNELIAAIEKYEQIELWAEY